ncbi:MAG TPA: tRNA (guanosine(46)-N7)-methyltransferase TrmB [Bacteroidetes bacterium]|nr:tRNA (guanosine(46)-N7)-methyltransferase TrmB [Bacteroidota bacterium]
MPHTFLKTALTPVDFVKLWQDQTFQIEQIRLKIKKGYAHTNGDKALFPCLVIEPFFERWFYVEMKQKPDGKLIIHADSMTPVERTAGVRLALAWFTTNLLQLDPQAFLEPGNLSDYLSLLDKNPRQQVFSLVRLQEKLVQQMKDAAARDRAKQFLIRIHRSKPPLDLTEIFGNENPVEIEIGPGKGKFILHEAKSHPELNFLAIEWAGRYLKILSGRLPKTDAQNLRYLQADARTIFHEWLGPASLAGVHIYYPDPWWKRKHRKYKLFSEEFMRDMTTALVPGGFLKFVTDVKAMHQLVVVLVSSAARFVKVQEKVYTPKTEPPPERTNFEIKKWQEGSAIFEVEWRRE